MEELMRVIALSICLTLLFVGVMVSEPRLCSAQSQASAPINEDARTTSPDQLRLQTNALLETTERLFRQNPRDFVACALLRQAINQTLRLRDRNLATRCLILIENNSRQIHTLPFGISGLDIRNLTLVATGQVTH